MRTQSVIPLLATLAGQACAQSIIDLLSQTESLSTLLQVASGFPDLVSTLGAASGITIFAPDNNALAALPQGLDSNTILAVLNYHVVNGVFRSGDFTDDNRVLTTLLKDNPAFVNVTNGQVMNAKLDGGTVLINDDLVVSFAGSTSEVQAQVTTPDITFDGGVVHIINSVLIPPTDIVTTLGTRQNNNINLSTLLTVLRGSGVAGTVADASDITLFAPNDPAWQGLDLASLSSAAVDNVLKYHVVQSQNVAYSSLLQSGNVTTLQGEDVVIQVVDEDNITVNGARVILPDILTANGVIHVIDGVLMPATDGTPGAGNNNNNNNVPGTVSSASTLSYAAWAIVASFLMAMAL